MDIRSNNYYETRKKAKDMDDFELIDAQMHNHNLLFDERRKLNRQIRICRFPRNFMLIGGGLTFLTFMGVFTGMGVVKDVANILGPALFLSGLIGKTMQLDDLTGVIERQESIKEIEDAIDAISEEIDDRYQKFLEKSQPVEERVFEEF